MQALYFSNLVPRDYLLGVSVLLAAIACKVGLGLCHSNAEQGFVSDLSENVYMRLLKGCGLMSSKVAKLCRSLHGLKQASRQWCDHMVRGIRGLLFEQCGAGACVMR